jgi:hypothetical protein
MPSDLPPPVTQPRGPIAPGSEYWRRILYMIGYSFIGYFVLIGLFFVAVVQALHVLLTQRRSPDVETLARNMTRYLFEVMAFVSWASDEKPFPAQSFPGQAPSPHA